MSEAKVEAQRALVASWLEHADRELLPTSGRDSIIQASHDSASWNKLISEITTPSSSSTTITPQTIAYCRACILAVDSTLNSTFVPLFHTLEEDIEDAEGKGKPLYEDAAVDVESLRWRNSTLPTREAITRQSSSALTIPIIRTPDSMASYVRLSTSSNSCFEQQQQQQQQLQEDKEENDERKSQKQTNERSGNSSNCECLKEHEDPLMIPFLMAKDKEGLICPGNNYCGGFFPEITHLASSVPDLPPPETCLEPIHERPLSEQRESLMVMNSVAKVLLKNGFGSSSKQALEILTDCSIEYMRRLCGTIHTRMNNLEIRNISVSEVNRSLLDSGIRGIACLRKYHEQVYPRPPEPPKQEQSSSPQRTKQQTLKKQQQQQQQLLQQQQTQIISETKPETKTIPPPITETQIAQSSQPIPTQILPCNVDSEPIQPVEQQQQLLLLQQTVESTKTKQTDESAKETLNITSNNSSETTTTTIASTQQSTNTNIEPVPPPVEKDEEEPTPAPKRKQKAHQYQRKKRQKFS